MAQGNKSLHSIAETLMTPADAPKEQAEAPEPKQPADDVPLKEGKVKEAEVVDMPPEDESVEAEVEYDDGEEILDDADDQDDQDDNQDDGSDDYLDISDDDLIEVKVDGRTEQFTIADAKRALSGEGAIDGRLKEATEMRKAAQAERQQMLDQFRQANDSFVHVVNQLEAQLLPQQTVQKPHPSMKQNNPDQYYRQLQEYQIEQQSLNEGKQYLASILQQQQAAVDHQQNEYRKEQANLLEQALPILRDREKGPELAHAMQEVAKRYGFREDEIAQALDHRYYLMVADLAKYTGARGAQVRKANTVKNLDGQSAKRPRKLRSGGGSVVKARARQQSEQSKQATAKARKTGKVKDVASTLITPRG